MFDPPFEILSCSWPRPVVETDGRWASPPEWDAPTMPYRPQPYWEYVSDELCWLIDWREFFRGGLKIWERHLTGEMKRFHIVFRIRPTRSGRLVFWDDDSCVIRRDGVAIHSDTSAHTLTRHEIDVNAGEELEVAQWQFIGGWLWGAHFAGSRRPGLRSAGELYERYLGRVTDRLARPDGPPLKLYCNGAVPIRTVLTVYSLILNGYAPNGVHLFGEHQWPDPARDYFRRALPFAHVTSASEVERRLSAVGGTALVGVARQAWWAMKACVALFCPPAEFCLIDDDVFVLDSVADALEAFRSHELVFIPDTDHGDAYLRAWGWMHGRRGPLPTGRFNAGLYWAKAPADLRRFAAAVTRVRLQAVPNFVWEQGLIANTYAGTSVKELPSARYFFPLFDGLPGGTLGYDYAANPCGFATIHFGGLAEKPSDDASLALAEQVLDRGNR